MDESLTETLHRATNLASKDTTGKETLWDITRNARDFSSFSTEIKTAADGVLPSCGLPLQVSTLKETGGYNDTLLEMLKSTPGEQIANAKCKGEDGPTVVTIATIAVFCAELARYPPPHVKKGNLSSLLWDTKVIKASKMFYMPPRKRTVVPDSTAGSACDADTEDNSDAPTEDVYDDNVGQYCRGADTTLQKDKLTMNGTRL